MADKVTSRREVKTASIITEAWELAREHGVGGVSLHGLARALGMRQPSLYEYFGSKHALYDAMFADGNRQLLARLAAVRFPADPRAAVKKYLATIVAFSVEDQARYELVRVGRRDPTRPQDGADHDCRATGANEYRQSASCARSAREA